MEGNKGFTNCGNTCYMKNDRSNSMPENYII